MSTRSLALAAFEQVLNRYIRLDPEASNRLGKLHGRVIAIHLSGLDLTLHFLPDQAGRLQVMHRFEGEADCRLSGSPFDLMRSGEGPQGARQLFAGQITVEGDTELAQRFGALLAELDIDWEEQLSRLTGDVVAHWLGRTARGSAAYLRDGRITAERNLAEYLTEEARWVPARAEFDGWAADVERLRDDTERLRARLERLLRRTPRDKASE